MGEKIIKNANIVNEGEIKKGYVIIKGQFIKEVVYSEDIPDESSFEEIVDAEGLYLMPGVIDDQVHFREPGLTHKGDIYSESKAAIAGGVTSFMEMPNTIPLAVTIDLLEQKYHTASEKSLANYSFYLGATNDNIEEIRKINPANTCGLKVFMGSSTGNMLVDNIGSLEKIFSESPVLIATHCEDETTIQKNTKLYREKYGDQIPISCHPEIRSAEACYISSSLAVTLAKKYNSRLHVLHISTAKEMDLFENIPLSQDKKITNEVCIHHLWFQDEDYSSKKTFIKWNPAVKSINDRDTLRKAVASNLVDVIATDHAPHTIEEKLNPYLKSPSGGPMVQHSLISMLQLAQENIISIPQIIQKMCHNPAILFQIEKRGFIRKDYFADIVLVDLNDPWTVKKDNILYKCKWSPMEGVTFRSKVLTTFVNGHMVYHNNQFNETEKGRRLTFVR